MKRIEIQGNTLGQQPSNNVSTRQHQETPYQKVCDERKRPIRNLWKRNDRFYAQLTLEDEETGIKRVRRVPLEGAATSAQAKQKLEELLVARRKGKLPVLRRTPLFTEYAEQYLEHHKAAKDIKRASTLKTEGYAITRWQEHLKGVRLDKINRNMVDRFIARRQKEGISARTVNLEVTVLRNVLNKAIDDKWITHLPTENLRPLKTNPPKRPLVTTEQMEKLCSVPFQPIFCEGRLAKPGEKGQPLQNAQQFSDYLRLLCLSGARLAEGLRLRFSDIFWEKRQLTISSDGQAKNGKWRVVDFNPQLEAHLKAMHGRRAPDSEWLFPSPRRGEEDRAAKTFRESLLLARAAAGLPDFGFHDCRHYFISMAVMAGIDYMTIAKWVGHQDGGILIGRVYGHLSDHHAQQQAKKLNLATNGTAQGQPEPNNPHTNDATPKDQKEL